MHIEAIAEPFLSLAANLALFALLVSFWSQVLSEVIAKILGESSGLCDNERPCQGRSFNRDDRGLEAMSVQTCKTDKIFVLILSQEDALS